MLHPRGEFFYDLFSGVALEAAQNVKSPEVLVKELLKKHLWGCWSHISEEKKLQCDFAQRSLDFVTLICTELR